MSHPIETYEEADYSLLMFAGLEDAFIGEAKVYGSPPVACYSKRISLQVLQDNYDLSKKDAWRKLHYEYMQTSFGDATPVFLDDVLDKPVHK